MDLYTEMNELMNELSLALRKLRASGEKLALAEYNYRLALTKESLRLKTNKMPVTLISQVIFGLDAVAKKRFERDVARSNYDVVKEDINVMKLKLRILESQLSREWSMSARSI